MDTMSLKKLLDACFTAKRIVETLPELPEGMKPRHIHVLDTVHEVYGNRAQCRVSDVSARLNITMPSITKLVQELEAMGMLEKYSDKVDKRVALLKLTNMGSDCVKKYVLDFQRDWAQNLSSVSDKQAGETIKIISMLQDTMPGGKEGKNEGKK